MSSYRVLISCPLIIDSVDEYSERFEEHDIDYDVADVDQQLTEEELLGIIDQYDGVLAGDDEFTSAVLDKATKLKVIAKWGIGIDAIDTEAAERNDVKVSNTPGAFSEEVADVIISYAIMLTRQLHLVDREVRNGGWFCPRGTSLSGKTFGVIGVGSIGSTVARRAHALGMDLLGTDIKPLPEELVEDTGIEKVQKDELLNRADVVSLNCALTPETHDLIGVSELEKLGEDGYLINTSRGELIDQAALIDALEDESIRGAALDVFEEEPLPAENQLTELDSVILGSHNAQNTTEAVDRVNDRAIDNLISGVING